MTDLGFDLPLIQWLFEQRSAGATALFQAFTFLGSVEGYVVIVAIVAATSDKRLAFRLAVVALLTMCLNHGLKTALANPRPFVAEGTWAEKWAVSPAKAQELVAEYSTPSGHAMAGAAFFGFLGASVPSRALRLAALAAVLLTGLSRPYLGVHYFEDVLLGWGIGLAIAIAAIRFAPAFARTWSGVPLAGRAGLVLLASAALFFATRPSYAAAPQGPPQPFVSYLGFLWGVVVAFPLERRWLDFDPRSGTLVHKALRAASLVGLVIGTLACLDPLFAAVAPDTSLLGSLLRFVRYAAAAIVGMCLGPWLCVGLGLASSRRRA